jgi:hypothetical protein
MRKRLITIGASVTAAGGAIAATYFTVATAVAPLAAAAHPFTLMHM